MPDRHGANNWKACMSFPYGEADSVAAVMIQVMFKHAHQVPGGDVSRNQRTESRPFPQADALLHVQVVGARLVQHLNDASA